MLMLIQSFCKLTRQDFRIFGPPRFVSRTPLRCVSHESGIKKGVAAVVRCKTDRTDGVKRHDTTDTRRVMWPRQKTGADRRVTVCVCVCAAGHSCRGVRVAYAKAGMITSLLNLYARGENCYYSHAAVFSSGSVSCHTIKCTLSGMGGATVSFSHTQENTLLHCSAYMNSQASMVA